MVRFGSIPDVLLIRFRFGSVRFQMFVGSGPGDVGQRSRRQDGVRHITPHEGVPMHALDGQAARNGGNEGGGEGEKGHREKVSYAEGVRSGRCVLQNHD